MISCAKMDEYILTKRLKAGDHKAFDEIYSRYAVRLMAFCHHYAVSDSEAQDIVQDTFVKLWNTRGEIRTENSLSTLIFTIARNRLLNAVRSAVNSVYIENYMDYCDSLADNETPAHTVEFSEFQGMLHDAIAKLSDTQQRVITLSKFNGLSNKEIAATLNLSEQTVRNQLSKGIKRLRLLITNIHTITLIVWVYQCLLC